MLGGLTRILLVLAATAVGLHGQPGAVDPAFKAVLGPKEEVADLVAQPDGGVLVLAEAPASQRTNEIVVLRFLPDGTRDSTFSTTPVIRGAYRAETMVTDSDRGIYISLRPSGGLWTEQETEIEADAAAPAPVVRLRPDGTRDPAFKCSRFFAVGPDLFRSTRAGHVWAAGRGPIPAALSLVLLGPDGKETSRAFHAPSGTWFNIHRLHEASDESLVLAGQIHWPTLSPRSGVVRLTPDNRPPDWFGSEGFRVHDSTILSIWDAAMDGEGRLIVSGEFVAVGQHRAGKLVRLMPDGKVDRTFMARDLDEAPERVWSGPNGTVLIGGRFSRVQGHPRPGFARLYPDGSLDTFFAPDLDGFGRSPTVCLADDGAVFIGGGTNLQRLLPGNPLPPAVVKSPVGINTTVAASHVLAATIRCATNSTFQWTRNGEVLPGATRPILDLPRLRMEDNGSYVLRATTPEGQLETTPVYLVVSPAPASTGSADSAVDFGGGPNGEVYALLALPQGETLVGGQFATFGGRKSGPLVLLQSDGTPALDRSEGWGLRGRIELLQRDGDSVLVGGSFATADRQHRSLARLQADGTFDAAFRPQMPALAIVESAARLTNGAWLVAGTFGTDPRNHSTVPLALIQPDGTVDLEVIEQSGKPWASVEIAGLADGRVALAGTEWGSSSPGSLVILQPGQGLAQATELIRWKQTLLHSHRMLFSPDGHHLVLGRGIRGQKTGGDSIIGPLILGTAEDGTFKPEPARFGRMFSVNAGLFNPPGEWLVAEQSVQRITNGVVDPAFRCGTDGTITAIARYGQGDYLIGGIFSKVGPVSRNNLALVLGSDRHKPYLLGPFQTARGIEFALPTNEGWTYEVESSTDAQATEWAFLTSFQGNGKIQVLENGRSNLPHQFFRVRVTK